MDGVYIEAGGEIGALDPVEHRQQAWIYVLFITQRHTATRRHAANAHTACASVRACKRAARVPIDPRRLHLLPLAGVVAALPGRVYRGPSRCLLASYATGYAAIH